MSDPSRPAKVAPETVLKAPRRPVARYRPWVIGALAGALMLLVGAAFLVAFGGKPEQATAPDASAAPDAPAAPPDLDRRLPVSYDDPLAIRGAPEPLSSATPAIEVDVPAAPPAPSPAAVQRLEERQAAHSSKPFFTGSATSARTLDPPLSGAIPPAVQQAAVGVDAMTSKERFIANAATSESVVSHLAVPPLSQLEIKAGTVISAALITGLNSDLPGPVIAQVTEPVFDHLTGRHVLIPHGARILGRYDSQVSYGQDRALVVWTRIIFADGRSLNIGAMTGADTTGAGGLSDRVDRHVPALADAIGLSSVLSLGASAAQNSLSRGSDNLVLRDGAGSLATSASETGHRLVDRDLQRAPTLRVRPGWPLRILVDKDLLFTPPS